MTMNFVQGTPVTPITVVTPAFLKADYEEFVFPIPKGNIFAYKHMKYEDVVQKIEEYSYAGLFFKITSIEPGNVLYAIHGAGHVLVTENMEL